MIGNDHDRYSKTDALFQREDKIDIRYGETENKCAEKTEGTPNIQVPIRSIAITYFVLPPLRMIPPPMIIFWTLNGEIMA